MAVYFVGSTGMHFRITAMIKLTAPIKMLNSHNSQLSGTVPAKVPKNSTIMAWKVTEETTMIMNIQLLNMSWKTFIFSISRLFISLNTWYVKNNKNKKNISHFIISCLERIN